MAYFDPLYTKYIARTAKRRKAFLASLIRQLSPSKAASVLALDATSSDAELTDAATTGAALTSFSWGDQLESYEQPSLVQYIATVLCSLPYTREDEALFVIHSIQRSILVPADQYLGPLLAAAANLSESGDAEPDEAPLPDAAKPIRSASDLRRFVAWAYSVGCTLYSVRWLMAAHDISEQRCDEFSPNGTLIACLIAPMTHGLWPMAYGMWNC